MRIGIYTILVFSLKVEYFKYVSIESQLPFYTTEIILTCFMAYLQLYLSKEQSRNSIQAPDDSGDYEFFN